MSSKITRITLFKSPIPKNRNKIISLYGAVATNAVKDGTPYILTLSVGPAHEDQRSLGYTIVAKTEFASLEDMRYYDEECEAHKEFKRQARGCAESALTIYYTPTVESGF